MCCFFLALVFVGPRLALLILWLVPYWRAITLLAFNGGWFLPILGLIFLPWLTLMYMLVYPVYGFFDWLLLGLAVAADVATYSSGYYRNRFSGWQSPSTPIDGTTPPPEP
jgi:hypothetical protein